jgi:hypothetical protein
VKRETAYKIAIECIEKAQREYIVGHSAQKIHGLGAFTFMERDDKKWQRLEDAKLILEGEKRK